MIITNENYLNNIKNWNKKFKTELSSSKNNTKTSLFILNKDFIDLPEKRGNLNKNIIKEYNEGYKIDVKKSFYILDDKTWLLIKKDFPSEFEIKVEGKFVNNKYIFKISDLNFYFYFINENNLIEEGYFIFENEKFGKNFIDLFLSMEINVFF